MDPKLKAYLDKQFKRLATKKDLQVLVKRIDNIDKKIDEKTSDILEVIRSVNSNIGDQVEKIDIAHTYLRQHVDHIFKRVDYLEKKILK